MNESALDYNGSLSVDFVSEERLSETSGLEFWALVLLVLPVVTVFGNVLVCMSVYTDRNLHTVTNYFIVSLAIADIMVGILVMPLAVYVEVNESVWNLGDGLCDAWVAFDVLCCTASILNLAAISVDRYTAITQPIRYAKQRHSKRVYVMLALVWVVSVAISSPIALGMNYTERREKQHPSLCIFYNSDFIIFSSMGSFYIPCLVMLLLYIRMFRTIRQRARLSVLRRGSTRPDTGSPRRTWSGRKEGGPRGGVMMMREDGARCEDGVLLPRGVAEVLKGEGALSSRERWRTSESLDDAACPLCPAPSQPDDGSDSAAAVELMPLSPPGECAETISPCLPRNAPPGECDGTTAVRLPHKDPLGECHRLSTVAPPSDCNDDECQDERRRAARYLKNARMSVTKLNMYLRQWPSQTRKDRSATRRERKATKTLAIVLAVFLFCWVPFFTLNITNAVCIRYELFDLSIICHIPPSLFSFFVWLGYVNSSINPVIYTIFNVEFRRAFDRLLRRPCNH